MTLPPQPPGQPAAGGDPDDTSTGTPHPPGPHPPSGPGAAPPPGYPYPPQQGFPPQGYPPQSYGPPGYPPPPGYAPPPGYTPPSGYPPQPYGPPGYPGGPPVSESDEKLWGLLAHISIPFLGFVGPLVVYLVYKDRSGWLRDVGLESLNFSILYSISLVVASFLTALLIGFLLLPLVFVGGLVLCILAAMAANRHEFYRYPVNWRLIS